MLVSRSSFEKLRPFEQVLAHLVAVEQLDPVAPLLQRPPTTMFAIVLLPAPERPVNQRQKPVAHRRAGYGRAPRT